MKYYLHRLVTFETLLTVHEINLPIHIWNCVAQYF